MDLEKLYFENKSLLYHVAKRYIWAINKDPANSIEDLMQQGFFGLVTASETYDESLGCTFKTWAGLFIRNEIRSLLGLRSTKKCPELSAISLDKNIGSDEDEFTLLDTLEDEHAQEAFDSVEDREIREQIRQRISAIEHSLQRQTMQLTVIDGLTQKQVAEKFGVSTSYVGRLVKEGRKALSKDPYIRELARIEDETPYYLHKGVMAFRSDLTSVTEYAALWRIEHKEKLENLRKIHLGTRPATDGENVDPNYQS